MGALFDALLGIVIAVGASGALFVGANKLFDQMERRWAIVTCVGGGLVGAAALALIVGLRSGPESTPLLGGPSLLWMLSGAAAGALLGAVVGMLRPPSEERRSEMRRRLRSVIFVGPALLFVILGLIIPLARTIYLSLYDQQGDDFVGLANYGDVLTNPQSLDLSGWAGIFGSRLFFGGVGLLVVAALVAAVNGRRRGVLAQSTVGSTSAVWAGGLLLAFAVFANLRGTVMNNLWWVVAVTFLSTVFGLAAAVMAERVRSESFAKSLIFLPMAISFVGAGIIWRFMYIARQPSKPQTGVLNAVWVWLGSLRPGTAGQLVAVGVLAAVTAVLATLSLFGVRQRQNGIAIGAAVAAAPVLYLIYRFMGPGLGGSELSPLGVPQGDTILFVQESPFNNVWLMVVLIWIQTGFAMVILSAAIKAVPGDLLEAARVDGANEKQLFFQVTMPTIAPTVTVVVTAMIVLVMKVFDIVRVMTNGNFGTQVIANEMWQRSFTEFNLGLGSALAVLLFLGVVPVMAINVRRMQSDV